MLGLSVLVTGAAGFLGQNLVRALQNAGHDIICVDDFRFGKPQSLSFFSGKIFSVDVTTEHFVNVMTRHPVDLIYHFGSPCSVIQFQHNEMEAINQTFMGALNVLRVAKVHKAKSVFPSSGNVYGRAKAHRENVPPEPSNIYGKSKKLIEAIGDISDFGSMFDTETVSLRIYAGYGAGEEHKGSISSAVTLFLNSMLVGERPTVWGDGSQTRDCVYVDDITRCFIAAGERKLPMSVINVGSGESHTFNHIIELLNECLGTNIQPQYVPKPSNYVERTRADITNMKRYLHVKPISLAEGIRKYVAARLAKEKRRKTPKLSVVVPTYNEGSRINALFSSLAQQTMADFEVVVVDGGSKGPSTDGTVPTAKKSGARVIQLLEGGHVAARNLGMTMALGKIVVFAEADMQAPPRWLENISKEFQNGCIGVAGPGIPIDAKSSLVPIEYAAYNTLRYLAGKFPHPFNHLSASAYNFAANREALIRLGGFNAKEQNDDGLLGRKLAMTGKTTFSKDAFVFISARRFNKMGFWSTNIHYLYVIENFLNLLSPLFGSLKARALENFEKDVRHH
jgi:UDP-glucose 4-epimerase